MSSLVKKCASSQKDTFLIRELKNSNEQAFEQLYYQYHRSLYGFLMKMIGSRKEVEDIIQEVFIRIWERRRDLNENLSFCGFLFTIGKNLCLNYIRDDQSGRRVKEHLKQIIDRSLDDVEQVVYFNELEQMVQQVLEQLPYRQQQVYTLNRIKGYSRHEIASMLHISIATVDMHMSKALKTLRNHLYKVRHSG